MSETTTRKAVVTTAQVQEAFASYVLAHVRNGDDTKNSNEFDKGLRGRGFAEYTGNGLVVRTFDTKEDALTYYSLLAEGMWKVLDRVAETELSKATADAVQAVTENTAAKSTRRTSKAAA